MNTSVIEKNITFRKSGLIPPRKNPQHFISYLPLKAFDSKNAKTLLKEGRVEDVIAYLESFEGGAAG